LDHYRRKLVECEHELQTVENELEQYRKDLESATEKALAMSRHRLKPKNPVAWFEKEIGQTAKRIAENERVFGRIEEIGAQLIGAKEEYRRTESFTQLAEAHVEVR
jgi:chromosome segregation ATPase